METPVSNIGQYLTAFTIRSVGQFFPSVWSIFLMVALVIALIVLLMGAIQWMTAGDDKEKMTSARSKIMGALIGLTIVFLAWAIYGLLMGIFGFPQVFQIPSD
ncbi:MAG: pilin [Candidatus Marinimicrobia bacterium]|nr:pilin [Candidatus Neomarinimicrobiota bacterium]